MAVESAAPSKRTMEQRHVLESTAVDGAAWLKIILDREHHTDHELASQLTDSPLKVRSPAHQRPGPCPHLYLESERAANMGGG